ncbi:MAG: hypothetical protein IPJ78_16850 [Gemmatimonadetes bacterium]|nr:hypothetical protein [Gemmatimonadota bacterium]
MTKNIAWPWAAECATAAGCRVTIPLTTWAYGSLPTRAYDYTLEDPRRERVAADRDRHGIVRGRRQPCLPRSGKAGIEGHERLVAIGDTTKMLWIRGDGSTRVFVKQSATLWTVVAQVARPERLERSGGFWYRRLRNGGSVKFDALLRHVATRNRQGDSTRFVYNATYATQLDSIVLPRPAGARPSERSPLPTAGRLRLARKIVGPSQVTGGAARVDSLEYDADSHLTRIIDPDLTSVRFLYYATRRRVSSSVVSTGSATRRSIRSTGGQASRR